MDDAWSCPSTYRWSSPWSTACTSAPSWRFLGRLSGGHCPKISQERHFNHFSWATGNLCKGKVVFTMIFSFLKLLQQGRFFCFYYRDLWFNKLQLSKNNCVLDFQYGIIDIYVLSNRHSLLIPQNTFLPSAVCNKKEWLLLRTHKYPWQILFCFFSFQMLI